MAGISISVDVDAGLTTKRLQRLDDIRTDFGPMLQVAGRSVVNLLKQNFHNLDTARANKLGGRRTHFYSQAARSVQQPVVSRDSATISINQVGVAQRYFGGTIRPGPGRTFLTIPARAEAYGRRAREFNNLRFAILPHGGPVLIEAEATKVRFGKRGARSGGSIGGAVMFWLRREVTQQPDPSVLPTEQAIKNAATSAAVEYLDREIARNQ